MNVLEKILEEIEEASIKVLTVKEHTYFKAVGTRKIKEIICSHMDEAKDTNVPSNNGWIPVEERLPKKPKYLENSYIVQTNDIIDPFSAYWDGEMWTDVNDDPVKGVIAWQPLPEPYRPKEKDDE